MQHIKNATMGFASSWSRWNVNFEAPNTVHQKGHVGLWGVNKDIHESNVRVREIHKTINSLCRSPVATAWKFMEQIYPQ